MNTEQDKSTAVDIGGLLLRDEINKLVQERRQELIDRVQERLKLGNYDIEQLLRNARKNAKF